MKTNLNRVVKTKVVGGMIEILWYVIIVRHSGAAASGGVGDHGRDGLSANRIWTVAGQEGKKGEGMRQKMKVLMMAALLSCSAFSLAGCTDNTQIEAGGWAEPEDDSITGELKAVFDNAMEKEENGSYVPLKLLETQVVAGMNYRFLCEEEGTGTQYIITIYENLDGDAEVTNIMEKT